MIFSTLFERIRQFILVNVSLILIPLGFINAIRDTFGYWRFKLRYYKLTFEQREKVHREKVAKVVSQVRKWGKMKGERVKMCSARPGYLSISETSKKLHYKSDLYGINLSSLIDLINVDVEHHIVRVEPGVKIGELNNFLIECGWTLPVVPELYELTIGGLVMGAGIETTSHKHGLFQNICKKFDMVMQDGQVMHCSESLNEDLFCAVPMSYGTLGFLTAVDLKIVPYKKYVRLQYHPIRSLEGIIGGLEIECNKDENDCVEAFMYSKDAGVLMTGRFVDENVDSTKPLINKIGRWYKEGFFKRVQAFLDEDSSSIEYIPTKDYFHRHSRTIFWLVHCVIPFADHFLFRWLLGWTLPPKHATLNLINRKLLNNEEPDENLILQDFILPLKSVKECLEKSDEYFGIYPVWICPARILEPMRHTIHSAEDILVDVGIYGFANRAVKHVKGLNSLGLMERFTIRENGFQALYARTSLNRDDFDKMFHHYLQVYNAARKKYRCDEAFPHIYEKVCDKNKTD